MSVIHKSSDIDHYCGIDMVRPKISSYRVTYLLISAPYLCRTQDSSTQLAWYRIKLAMIVSNN